jgi:predicted alpha/beta hydrolase family esterase
MDRQFLVLHGLGNRRPRAHWQWWLVEQLRRRGERVRYPQLPDPDRPALARWLDALATEYAQMGAGERIVVCHSLACALWYQASSRGLIDPPADRLVLVAPPGPSVLAEPASAPFAPRSWDAAIMHASCTAPIRLVASDADPYCQEGPAALVYGSTLGVDSDTVDGAGHFTPADGYGPWPALLDWCLDASACVDFGATGSHSA